MNSDLKVKSNFFGSKLVSDSLDDPFLLTEWTTLILGSNFYEYKISYVKKNLTKIVSNGSSNKIFKQKIIPN